MEVLHWVAAALKQDGCIVVTVPDGRSIVVEGATAKRTPLAPLPRGVLWIGTAFGILEFEDAPNGAITRSWILSPAGLYLGDWAGGPLPERYEALTAALIPALRHALGQLCTQVIAADECAPVQAFLRVGRRWRIALNDLAGSASSPASQRFLWDIGPGLDLPVQGDQAAQRIPLERLRRVFYSDPRAAVHETLATGRFPMPALLHDGMAEAVRPVQTDTDWCALQIRDGGAGSDWICVFSAGLINYYVVAVIVPKADTLLFRHPQLVTYVPSVLASMQRALVAAGPALAGWRPQAGGSAVATRSLSRNHIGHLVWNVYPGIETALALSVEGGSGGLVVHDLAGASDDTPYGPLVQLFPELRGRVRLTEETLPDAFAAATAENRHLIPVLGASIPLATRRRLLRAAATDATACAALHLAAVPHPANSARIPALILGIRLQNRSMPDLLGFYVRLIRRLMQAAGEGPFTVILDGMNISRMGRAPRVGDSIDTLGILEREHAFAAALKDALSGLPVRLVNCVGTDLLTNIALLKQCDYFVAPNGAGLVKLRWIHRLPGFVLTNAQSLRFGDLVDCYGRHVEVEEEVTAPLNYTAPEEVEDLHHESETFDERGRARNGWRGGMNSVDFRLLDESAIFSRIEASFLEALSARDRNESAFQR